MSAKNITLSVSADTAEKMGKLSEVNWSKIARDAIDKYVNDRLDNSVPADVLIRLRIEKGEEYANGKKLAIEKISSNVNYKRLASFLEKAVEKAENMRRCESRTYGVPEEDISLDMEGAALNFIRDSFSEIPKGSSNEFCKGVFSVLNDIWVKLNE